MPRGERAKGRRPSEAHDLAYAPADGSDWNDPDPVSVGDALDSLAGGAVGGSGDVVGPASAADNAVARFNSTTGKLIQNSALLVTDGSAYNATLVISGITATRYWTFPDVSGTVVLESATQTLAAKTLTTPTIGDFTNATHDHADNAGGGAFSTLAVSTKVTTPEIESSGNITLDPANVAAESKVIIENSHGSYKADLTVEGCIAAGGVALGLESGNVDIHWTRGGYYSIEIDGANIDIDFVTPPPLPSEGYAILHVMITQDTSPYTVTWNNCSNWVRSEIPVQSTGSGAKDLYTFLYDGTTYYGWRSPNFGS